MSSMSVEAIKEAIAELPREEKVSLAAWLSLQNLDDWDREMQRDFSPGGRGSHVVEQARSDIRAGKFRPMSEGRPRGNP
ncbi:MAG: hypothetical protein GY953_35115 [bacterium]|nr:hypothetical protein [bacterium]